MKIIKKVKWALVSVWIFIVLIMLVGTIVIGRSYLSEMFGDGYSIQSLYSISDPFNADLSPDDFVGTWETQNGIIFTIQYLDGEYTIDLSENNLGILGGRFSDYLYNVEDAFCGMAGTSGTTSFSVYYEYGSDYPTSSWLVLDLTESNGNEVLDYVPLT